MFYISLLELVYPETLIIVTTYYRNEELKEYKIERILDKKY